MKLRSERAGGKGIGRTTVPKWKEEITDQRVTRDEYLIQPFIWDVFLSENTQRCYVGVLKPQHDRMGGVWVWGGPKQVRRVGVRQNIF